MPRGPRTQRAKKQCDALRTAVWSKTKMCKFFPLGMCCQGSGCPFAHDERELQPLPDLACTKICRALVLKGVCNDPTCKFAHGSGELRGATTEVRRSRGPCRFWLRGTCVLGDRCTHAHEHMPEWVANTKDASAPTRSEVPALLTQHCDQSPQINSCSSPLPTVMLQPIPLMALPTLVMNHQVIGVPYGAATATDNYSSQAYGGEFGDSPPPSPRMLLEACECGHMFMKDCRFCRMCGKKRCAAPKPAVCGCGSIFLDQSLFCHSCGAGRCINSHPHLEIGQVHNHNDKDDTDSTESVSAGSTAATDSQSEKRTSYASQQNSPRANWADLEDEAPLATAERH
jgi:hypothetical protein